MIRFFDLILASLFICLGFPLILLACLVAWLDTGSPVFRQQRLGRDQQTFSLLKFRTMHRDTPSVATHLAAATAVTRWGRLLRTSKLDELPQLFNVLCGQMSIVGPRPNLPNQVELIAEREKHGVYRARPGITGLAQIQGIDMSTPALLAQTDAEMLQSLGLLNYFKYIVLTVLGRGRGDRVRFE